MCSQLQGKTFCDCNSWKGVCVYQEYILNRSQIKECRNASVCQIVSKEMISSTAYLLTILVGRKMARELSQPGSYVFVRNLEEPAYFDTPLSVMTACEQEEYIVVAVQTRGVKTKALGKTGDQVYIRGPYHNGLLGLKYLLELRNQRALIIARGISQAPALPVARKLVLAGNKVDVILDPGRVGCNFTESAFRDLGCNIILSDVFSLHTLTITENALKIVKDYLTTNKIKLLYCAGPERLYAEICHLINHLCPEVYFTCANDIVLCCGEGICGSCHTRLKDGKRVKICKTQLNPMEIFEGR
jgi:dihydroorotate dehydrogenase electron transfer subunit